MSAGRVFHKQIFKSGFAEATVIAKKMPKTVMCAIKRRVTNQKYGAVRTCRSVLMVHDEINETVPGDRVLLKQCRPRSKRKHWMIYDIIQKYKPVEFLKKNPEYVPIKSVEPWSLIPGLNVHIQAEKEARKAERKEKNLKRKEDKKKGEYDKLQKLQKKKKKFS
eukprot:TRINITY_DN14125_c0_g1_i1.p1 TRINITY_DN14125_c0_g1~~TRINITY_DN14125_c0_g1_i1.p1  ORF type:complete len:164 (-),score=26.44 TRINITY_DN14125_c0_g1_i1:37-528(-)